MADHAQPAAVADPAHAIVLDDVEAALMRAIYGGGRAWRPNGCSVVGVAMDVGGRGDGHAVGHLVGQMAIPSAAVIRERHSTHAPLRAFIAAVGGRGWPWAAARIASWREDVVLMRVTLASPIRVLRVRNGIVLGEDQPGSTGYASVVRVLHGAAA